MSGTMGLRVNSHLDCSALPCMVQLSRDDTAHICSVFNSVQSRCLRFRGHGLFGDYVHDLSSVFAHLKVLL